MEIRNLIDFCDLTNEEWNVLCELGQSIQAAPERYSASCRGRILATLFYEPSTRTQLSFQTAMLRLGGSVIGFADPNSSSVKKGESLRDTIKIIANYADITVIRNPVEGAAYASALYSRIPVINAGDGGHLHPTQTMADMYTVMKEKGRYSDLSIGFCGDLLNGRTVHSLTGALMRYPGNRFYFISTKELGIPAYLKEHLDAAGIEYHVVNRLEDCIEKLDILYMTRIQKERFPSAEEYNKQSGVYVLNREKMSLAKPSLTVLHPLPKIDEIEPDVDDDPRAKYFEQAENGLYMRMALILTLCEANRTKDRSPRIYPAPVPGYCHNPRCITNYEKYLPKRVKTVDSKTVCAYCDHELTE